MVNARDLVKLLMRHSKMSSLLDAAGDTHVEVNSGGVDVIARAVNAAINPTEGQRMLQASFQGAILGGESREKTSTTINADGIERVDRVLESSVVSENGQSVLVQSVQQSAQQLPPMPNIDMAANPEFAIWKTDVMSNMKHLLDLSTVTTKLWHKVDAVENQVQWLQDSMNTKDKIFHAMTQTNLKEIQVTKGGTNATIKELESKIQTMRDENQATIKSKDKQRRNKRQKRDTKDAAKDEQRAAKDKQRDAKDEERDAKDAERDAKDAERDAKDAERDKLLAFLQRASCNEKKRPADNQGEGTSQKKSKKIKSEPRYITKTGSNSFMWKKTTDGIEYYERGFKTIKEASKALAVHLENKNQSAE